MLKLPAKRHGQDKEDSGLGAKMLVVVGVLMRLTVGAAISFFGLVIFVRSEPSVS